jgi:hypothetical protein
MSEKLADVPYLALKRWLIDGSRTAVRYDAEHVVPCSIVSSLTMHSSIDLIDQLIQWLPSIRCVRYIKLLSIKLIGDWFRP